MKIFKQAFVILMVLVSITCCQADTTLLLQDQQSDLLAATVTQLTDDIALLRWEKVAGQDVTYTVWLNGKEIHTNIKETKIMLKALNTNSSYAGEILATDSKGDTWKIPISNFRVNYPGQVNWKNNLGGFGEGFGQFVVRASDGGYLVVIELVTENDRIVLKNSIAKFDFDGNQQWETSLGSKIRLVIVTSDRGYALAGNTQPPEGHPVNADVWILKLDADGNPQWRTSLGGPDVDHASYFFQASDGVYVVGGSSNSAFGDAGGNHGGNDYWIVRLDTLGNLLNEHNLGGSGMDYAHSVIEAPDRGHVIVAETWRCGQ